MWRKEIDCNSLKVLGECTLTTVHGWLIFCLAHWEELIKVEAVQLPLLI